MKAKGLRRKSKGTAASVSQRWESAKVGRGGFLNEGDSSLAPFSFSLTPYRSPSPLSGLPLANCVAQDCPLHNPTRKVVSAMRSMDRFLPLISAQ